MKAKFSLLLSLLFLGMNAVLAQQNEECMTNLSIFAEYVKAKNFEAAYEPWLYVRKNCPALNKATFVLGEDILEYKMENNVADAKIPFINDLILLWDERMQYFPNDTKVGETMADQAQLLYDEHELLGKTDEELYNAFDKAYKTDKDSFTNPKSLYTYFSLMVDLYDDGKKESQELFDKYDDVAEKINLEVKNYTQMLNKLVTKETNGGDLTKKEEKYKKFYESYLNAYDQVSGSMDTKLGDRANCTVLVDLYNKNFEQYKNDAVWLQRAVGRMDAKDCTDDPLFFKLVNAYHETNPSAKTAYYLGYLKDKEGKIREAIKYYNQAIDLEVDPYEKADIQKKVGLKLKKAGQLSSARTYLRNALQNNPSMGECHLAIAQMYAASANNCGNDAFEKRSVYWLAAAEARKAGQVNAKLRSLANETAASYEGRAPSKAEIFQRGNAGETISFNCWVGGSVRVPQI